MLIMDNKTLTERAVWRETDTACPLAKSSKQVLRTVTKPSTLSGPKRPHAFPTSVSPGGKHLPFLKASCLLGSNMPCNNCPYAGIDLRSGLLENLPKYV